MALTRVLFVLLVSGVLHAFWEASHTSLYRAYEVTVGGVPVLVYATLGDLLYVGLTLFLVSLLLGGFEWLSHPRGRHYGALALLGCWIALFVEYKALALSRWAYTEAMPVVPHLEVGLSPLVQMTVLLPLAVFVGTTLYRYAYA